MNLDRERRGEERRCLTKGRESITGSFLDEFLKILSTKDDKLE
jgi:hypothetical protein